jgi:dimethylamine/trimethylamine dehydrogenase
VVLATGASWRRDGVARYHRQPVEALEDASVFTPDDIIAGRTLRGPVVVFDDDHYYMGGIVAELLRRQGLEVTIVTPAPLISQWTVNTMEQPRIQARLLELGVTVLANNALIEARGGEVKAACVFTRRQTTLPAASVVMVTSRVANNELRHQLDASAAQMQEAGIKSVSCIGDCLAPGTIAAAVFSGHRYAREFERASDDRVPFLREVAELGSWSAQAPRSADPRALGQKGLVS